MPRFRWFDVYVEVEGVTAPEYDAKVQMNAAGVPCVTCWVPSESGKRFKVHCVDYRATRSTDEYVFTVDGVFARGTVMRAEYGGPPVTTLAAIPTPDGHRELVFTDLGTTDDERALRLRGAPNLGEIALRITPVRILAYGARSISAVRLAQPVVHERSKKAGVHAVQPGAPVQVPPSNAVQTQHIAMPFAIFIFRYRPLSLLQAQGIAPPPVTAHLPPPPAGRAAADMTKVKTVDESDDEDEEEIRRLEERLRQLRKRKRSTDIKVKEEPSTRRPRLSSATDFIDLASD